MNATVHTFRLGPDREGARVVQVPLQALRFHPRNIRTNLGDVTALAESIRHEGVLVPLMAERRSSGGLQLLHGHRRWAAADLAGLRRVPCVIVPEHSDDEAMLVMLAENTGREAVAPTDLQAAIQTLTSAEFGYSVGAIAVRLGVSEKTVRDWRAGRMAGGPIPAPVPGPEPERPAARPKRPARPPRPASPKIRPTAVHDLIARWDAGGLAAADLVAELRGWLGDWTPTTERMRAAAADPNAGPVPEDVVTQVDWLDKPGMSAAELAEKIGCSEQLVWRARAVLTGRRGASAS